MNKSSTRAPNKVLEGLPYDDYQRLFPYLSSISLSFADVLTERNATVRNVFFPTSGLIAIHTVPTGRASLAFVGSEGMIGSSVAAGVDAPAALIVVQGAGTAMRMDARRFRLLADRSISLQRQIHRYTLGLLERASQMAVCNGVHSVESRLARGLLETSDRARTDELRITQQLFAYLIGARRSGVSIAATSMRRRKLIAYARGRLQVLNRKALSRLACGCYEGTAEHS